MITINHPVPFFDDSYAVDSANVGPYNDFVIILEPPLPRPPPCARFHHHRTHN